MCNEGSGWRGEDRVELLKGLNQVVLAIGDSTAGSVGVGCACVDGTVCVCVAVSLDAMCVCAHVFAAEPAVFGICADCSWLSPPSKYQCLCVSCQASGPLCPRSQPAGQFGGAQPPQSHPHWQHVLFIWEITAQLSTLAFNFLSALTDQEESVLFKQARIVKGCGKVMSHNIILGSNIKGLISRLVHGSFFLSLLVF